MDSPKIPFIRRCSGYVEQFDVQSVTVETVLFSAGAETRSGSCETDHEKQFFVDGIIRMLSSLHLLMPLVWNEREVLVSRFEQEKTSFDRCRYKQHHHR
jgi:hypothetical protein